jgi:hypothetical protein
MPAFGRKSEILSPKSETDRMEAERQIPARFTEHNLKKQSQFTGLWPEIRSTNVEIRNELNRAI